MKTFKKAVSFIMALTLTAGALGISAVADEALPENASYVTGDADGDAIVNSADALKIIMHTSGEKEMTDIVRKTAADVNADGKLNSTDALYILNYKVGNVKEFPRPDYNLKKVAGNIMVDPYSGCIVDAQGLGLLGYAYDAKGNVFYATGQGWQRTFGYTELYDRMAAVVAMPLDTIRVKFNYAGKQWMVQLWKGFYGYVFAGCEIGFYNRPGDTSEDNMTYNVVSEDYYQDITCSYHYAGHNFTRTAKTWWLTGFTPALQVLPSATIPTMDVETTIRFTDMGLFNAFVGGLKKVDHIFQNYNGKTRSFHFIEGSNLRVNNNGTVWFEWK